jgi:sulfatase maturation enzyme AslB (radical SAM superfamily)
MAQGESSKPLCLAPFAGFVIDTNKGVRPCCTYEDEYLGNLLNNTLLEILSNQKWASLRDELSQGRWPKGCLNCKEREAATGFSVRKLFRADGYGFNIAGWEAGSISYMEFAGSNLCNLACLHCSPGFSTSWQNDYERLVKLDPSHPDRGPESETMYRTYRPKMPQPNLVINSLKSLPLEGLKTINFKGGEPFLNSETESILNYLKSENLLKNIEVTFTTNGTIFNRKIVELLAYAKKTDLFISVDAVGQFNQYLRYGESHTDLIEKNINQFDKIPNVRIDRITSVMNYNVRHLPEVRDWWNDLSDRSTNLSRDVEFKLIVTNPVWLSPNVLSQYYRKESASLLKEKQYGNEFSAVIRFLDGKYEGEEMHSRWVKFTRSMEKIRRNSVLAFAPELELELEVRD